MKTPKKIAIVHELFVKMGGAERVIQSLLKKFPQADIFTLLKNREVEEENFAHLLDGKKIISSRLQKFVDWGVPRQFLVTKMPRAIEDFDFSDYDLVISSSSAFAHGIITPSTVPHISYIHAPMRYAWDYTHEYIREKSVGVLGWLKKIVLQKILYSLRIWDYSASVRPDVLLANSGTTQQRIEKFWRRNSQVVFPPVDIERFEVSEENNNFFLLVSAIEPFKSIEIAVRAFMKMPEKKLVIIGDGSQRKFLEEISTDSSNIEFIGKKSDTAVKNFMEKSAAFIFPGLEDFGITPVEAMACGKPVICYGKGGVTESVIDGKTGIFFPELTADSLQKAVENFDEKFFTKKTTQKKIRARAEEFSEENFLKNIEKVVGEI